MQELAEEGGLWFSLLFDPEDGSNMFLRNIAVPPNSTALKPKGRSLYSPPVVCVYLLFVAFEIRTHAQPIMKPNSRSAACHAHGIFIQVSLLVIHSFHLSHIRTVSLALNVPSRR
jgi:hypothetical protein